jgi:hypothetical protein
VIASLVGDPIHADPETPAFWHLAFHGLSCSGTLTDRALFEFGRGRIGQGRIRSEWQGHRFCKRLMTNAPAGS